MQADTVQGITFAGNDSVTIPQGEKVVSDTIDFKVEAQQVLAVSLYSKTGVTTGAVTGHPGSRTNSWLAVGDQTAEGSLTGSEVTNTAHWYVNSTTAAMQVIVRPNAFFNRYFISALEAQVPSDSKVLAILGDSITDGRGSDDDKNNR